MSPPRALSEDELTLYAAAPAAGKITLREWYTSRSSRATSCADQPCVAAILSSIAASLSMLEFQAIDIFLPGHWTKRSVRNFALVHFPAGQ